jgi:drug/metabolite transporter (DMT)-like permease
LLLLLWSTNFIFARLALRELPLALVLGFRFVFSAVGMLPVVLVSRRSAAWQGYEWKWSEAPALLSVGLLGLVGNQVLFVIGISMTSVAHAGVITALSPVLVLVGSALFGLERITRLRIVGLLTAAAGVVLLQFSRGAGGEATRKGAAFNLLGKPIVERVGSLRMNAITYSAAGLLALPLALWNMHGGAHASLLAWMGVVYMAVGSSVAGYLIYAHALRHLPASRVSVVVYLQPLVVSVLAILLLGERPGAGFLPAAALVLTGVYVVERLG